MAVGGGDYLRSQAAFSRLRSRRGWRVGDAGSCRLPDGWVGGYSCRALHELAGIRHILRSARLYPLFLRAFGGLSSPLAGHIRMLGDALPPAQWDGLPHALRQAFPIIETLDGRVLSPLKNPCERWQSVTVATAATFLALKKEQNSCKE